MPLTLVTGPANAAKAGEVLGGLRARLEEEPILVVPALRTVLRRPGAQLVAHRLERRAVVREAHGDYTKVHHVDTRGLTYRELDAHRHEYLDLVDTAEFLMRTMERVDALITNGWAPPKAG